MKKRDIMILMILAISIVDMASDMYVPSLPELSTFFNVDKTITQLTVSLNFTALAFSSLFYGPLSDHYGRKPIILLGMTIFTVSSILCCFANSILSLIIVRFIQGLGAGVAAAVGYSVVKDMFSGEECAKVLSKMSTIIALSPAVAPIIGSFIISHGYNWHLIFIIISIISSIILMILFLKMKETIACLPGGRIGVFIILKKYLHLLGNFKFLGFAFIQSLTIMWLFSYIGNLPFIFTEGMKISIAYYGYFVAMSVTCYIIGTIVNQKFVERVGINRMLLIGLVAGLVSDIVIVSLFYTGNLNVIIAEIVWIPSNLGIALIIGNNMTSALESVKETGLGSAFIIALQTICGSLGIYIGGYFYNGTLLVTSIMTIICSSIAIILYIAIHMGSRLTKKGAF